MVAVAIKDLLFSCILLIFISSASSRGVKQFRSARHRLQVRLEEETRQVLARSSRGNYRELERDKEVSLGRYQVRSMSDLLARRRLNRQRHGSSRTRPRAGRQEMGASPVFPNFEAAQAGNGDPMEQVGSSPGRSSSAQQKQEEEDSDDDDDIVFSDYEAAVAGVGDPMAPVRPPTSTTTLPPTTSTLASTSVSSSPVTPESTSTDSVSDIDPRIVNRPAEGEGMDSNNSDEGDFVFPEETTQPPTLGVEPSLGGIDPSLLASPLSLSPCLPLNLLNCGILANPGLTDGLLEFVEAGNIGTDQVNGFLDSALEMAASALGPVQVQVNPGDLQMEGGGLDERDLVGDGGCSDKVALTSWSGQAVNIGVARLEDKAGLQVNGWLQGEVPTEGEVKAALEATYTRDILIKCLTVTTLRAEARAELTGTLAIGVRIDSTDIRLDYRTGDEAELHLRMGLLIEGVLVGLDDEATIDGCLVSSPLSGRSELDACPSLASHLTDQAALLTNTAFPLRASSELLDRIGQILGVKVGETVRLPVTRMQGIQGRGRSPQTDEEPEKLASSPK